MNRTQHLLRGRTETLDAFNALSQQPLFDKHSSAKGLMKRVALEGDTKDVRNELLLAMPRPTVGLESNIIAQSLFKDIFSLFKRSHLEELRDFGKNDWSTAKIQYETFLQRLTLTITNAKTTEYNISNFADVVGILPFTKDNIDVNRIDDALTDFIKVRDAGGEFIDLLFSYYEKYVFIKGKPASEQELKKREAGFWKEVGKLKGYSKPPKWHVAPPWYKERKYKPETIHFESLDYLSEPPMLERTAETFIDIEDYSKFKPEQSVPKSVTVSKQDLLRLITLAQAAISEFIIDPYNVDERSDELEERLGFAFYYDKEGYIDEDDWDNSVGAQYFELWDTALYAGTNFTYHPNVLTYWDNLGDIRTAEAIMRFIAICIDNN